MDSFFWLSLLFEFDGDGDGFCSALLTVGDGEGVGRTSGVGDGLASAATLASGAGTVGRIANNVAPMMMTTATIADNRRAARKDFLLAVRGTSTLANLLSN